MTMSDDFERRLTALEERLSPHGLGDALRALGQCTIGPHPNINYFNARLRDYELAILNIKQMGWLSLGRRISESLSSFLTTWSNAPLEPGALPNTLMISDLPCFASAKMARFSRSRKELRHQAKTTFC